MYDKNAMFSLNLYRIYIIFLLYDYHSKSQNLENYDIINSFDKYYKSQIQKIQNS